MVAIDMFIEKQQHFSLHFRKFKGNGIVSLILHLSYIFTQT